MLLEPISQRIGVILIMAVSQFDKGVQQVNIHQALGQGLGTNSAQSIVALCLARDGDLGMHSRPRPCGTPGPRRKVSLT